MTKFMEQAAEIARSGGGPMYTISQICKGKQETVQITPANPCQNSYSVAKIFTVTAIGLLVDDGLLNVNERIVDIFTDELPEGMDEKWNEMTVHHALKHSCGFNGGYMDIDCCDANIFGDDYLDYMFKTKLNYVPGTDSTYSDAAFYLLSRVVTKKCGRKMDDLMWERVFYPLGYREMAWSKCPKGYPMGATGLYIYTEDMAKLGEVYLRGGIYNGKRIISENWVNTVITQGYEFHWEGDGKAYGKGGMRCQKLMVIPSQDRVLAWHSYEGASLTAFAVNYED